VQRAVDDFMITRYGPDAPTNAALWRVYIPEKEAA
jgi:hypothetical protein